jgi:hypothetical protein
MIDKKQKKFNRQLFDLLNTKGYNPTSLDVSGDPIPVPEQAEVIQFTFTNDGKDYGKVTLSMENSELFIYFSDTVADSDKDPEDGESWYQLLNHLKKFAQARQMSFKIKNSSHLKHDMAKRDYMKKQDNLAEGYYPMGKKASYNDAVPSVKIVLQHTRAIEEGEQRYRNVERIFLENTDGERFLAPTTKPGIARVYARHIAEGGKPHDERWNHINSLCEEYQKMAGFVRATRNGQFNESTQQLITEGVAHYQSLRESLSKMAGQRGYNTYFESWTPALMEDESDTSNINELFVQETVDPRIESVMPILSKLHKKVAEMKEVDALSEWADTIIEGDGGQEALNPIGVPEGKGEGNLAKAIQSLGRGWYQEDSYDPNIEQFEYDDREGGFYANGSIEHNLKTGEIEVHFHDSESDEDIDGVFHSIGDAMNALRGGFPGSHGGRAQNYDSLAGKTLFTPDDVRKTDRAGKKGTIGKARMDGMKASSKYTMRGGPKGVLPEGDMPAILPENELHIPNSDRMSNDERHKAIMAKHPEAKRGKTPGSYSTKSGNLVSGIRGVRKVAEEEVDESALQAYLGDKKYGKDGMDALRKAGQDHASEKKMQNIRAKFSKKEEPVAEDLDSDQIRAGQLGPTSKVKNNNIGKLVGANEAFDPLKHIAKDKQTPDIKKAAKDVDRGDYAARVALNKAGGVKDDRGPIGVKEGQEDLDAILRIVKR